MQLPIKHLLCAGAIAATGCTQPDSDVTTADIRNLFTENLRAFNELAAMLKEDEEVEQIDESRTIREAVSVDRHKRHLKVLRDLKVPVHTVYCDRSDRQLTVNLFVDGWEDKRLVYTNGPKPQELNLLCNECPSQLFESITGGWFVGIVDDSALVGD
jgi:hypothetical protein